MTEAIFTKYKLRWFFTDEGILQESIFWLPSGEEPKKYIQDILNIVELSADEYNYEYELTEIETRVYRMVG